jgi:hypothetical protein
MGGDELMQSSFKKPMVVFLRLSKLINGVKTHVFIGLFSIGKSRNI